MRCVVGVLRLTSMAVLLFNNSAKATYNISHKCSIRTQSLYMYSACILGKINTNNCMTSHEGSIEYRPTAEFAVRHALTGLCYKSGFEILKT